MSNVSAGAAYFQDPDGYGWVYHRAGSFGPGLQPVTTGERLAIEQGVAGDAAMTDRFCEDVLKTRRPALAVLWLSEPDYTGHRTPLGSPAHLAAIAGADRCVQHVLQTLAALGDGEETLLIVGFDHGMETTGRTIPVDRLLVEAGLKAAADSRDVVVAPNGSGGADLALARREGYGRGSPALSGRGRLGRSRPHGLGAGGPRAARRRGPGRRGHAPG